MRRPYHVLPVFEWKTGVSIPRGKGLVSLMLGLVQSLNRLYGNYNIME